MFKNKLSILSKLTAQFSTHIKGDKYKIFIVYFFISRSKMKRILLYLSSIFDLVIFDNKTLCSNHQHLFADLETDAFKEKQEVHSYEVKCRLFRIVFSVNIHYRSFYRFLLALWDFVMFLHKARKKLSISFCR